MKFNGSFGYGDYDFSDSSQILHIYGNPSYSGKIIFTFQLISYSNGFSISLKTTSTLTVVISFGKCLYSCDACFYNYETCNIESCQNDYSFFKGKDETNKTNCAPNKQIFKNYIYNYETNYFEECFHTCLFCSLMNSSSSKSQQNCLVCSDGYQKSYEYMGNCYKIDRNYNSDKIIEISDKGGEKFYLC